MLPLPRASTTKLGSKPRALIVTIRRMLSKIGKSRQLAEGCSEAASDSFHTVEEYRTSVPLRLREYCIGLCHSYGYYSAQESGFHLGAISPIIDWDYIRLTMLHHSESSLFDSHSEPPSSDRTLKLLRHSRIDLGVGVKEVDGVVFEDRILVQISTILPVDSSFSVRITDHIQPSSKQSRCFHLNSVLESDYSILLQSMKSPPAYDARSGSLLTTELRRCYFCPSEYQAFFRHAEYDGTVPLQDHDPYELVLVRWVDFGQWRSEPSEEFKALVAGQVCCDYRSRKWPPTTYLCDESNWLKRTPINMRFNYAKSGEREANDQELGTSFSCH